MYSPNFYREERDSLIHELIRDYPFALLLTVGGEQISHLPFILEKSGEDRVTLLGHMARANPHWQELSEKGQCKIIFQGPHGYISPAWYAPKAENVPTWSYAVVHATGRFEILREKAAVFAAMNRMVTIFESAYETGWKIPADEKAIGELLNRIVVFQISGIEFEAKFKLNQKQNLSDRENVITQLRATGAQALVDLAKQIEKVKNG